MRRSLLAGFVLFSVLCCSAQDQSAWQALTQLHAGGRVRMTWKSHADVTGAFQASTPDDVTIGSTTAKREDVIRIERYTRGGGRGKSAAIGAGIGAGVGAGIGAGLGGGCGHQIGPCVTRAEGAGIVAGVGAVIGAVVGVLIPHHHAELIYAAK